VVASIVNGVVSEVETEVLVAADVEDVPVTSLVGRVSAMVV
jgi:hypothetical protein